MANLYLAYGSNMNTKQMDVRCPTARLVGSTTLKDCELIFQGINGGAYATIRKNPGKETPVLIWELDGIAESRLDNYEGYPTFYGKVYFRIELNGKPTRVMAYTMKRGFPMGVPDRHYYEGIMAGYLAAGFDPKILDEAVRTSDPDLE